MGKSLFKLAIDKGFWKMEYKEDAPGHYVISIWTTIGNQLKFFEGPSIETAEEEVREYLEYHRISDHEKHILEMERGIRP